MPSPETILQLATTIANDYRTLAIGWHLLLGIVLVALLTGWRPSNRFTACLLIAPLLSVSALSWASGNPFNGTTFAAFAVWFSIVATRMSNTPVHFASWLVLVPGALLFAYGWAYPHFLATEHWAAYTYASPFGLLPCPTLSVAIGLTLMLDMMSSRLWSLTLAAAGFVYGAIGVFVLGVTLDYGLLAGAVVLGVASGGVLTRSIRDLTREPMLTTLMPNV